ncbi:oligoendopeptidase F [Deinococcus metalli]|uniref:Oligoendopeptidase F n=1 Tax=Deinococcus metalli TaxID=1141878 RepID=A0A7W8KGX1_9DEIO|nr:M3 family oligoendopeptidase [Deinococcus metalli]MBB5377966.1 oligoendopeptidase F [Deinococcus metalli]GHF54801.1 oligoendopeptidase F [Deinococcus metalli]
MTGTLDAVERTLATAAAATRWDTYAPRVQALLDEALDAAGVPGWLERWSALSSELAETGAKLSTHADLHTDQPQVQERYQAFLAEVMPSAERADQALRQKLLAVPGYVPDADTALTYRRFRDAAALFREANVDLGVVHEQQKNRHSVLTGNQTVWLDGEALTTPQARLRLDRPDRAAREAAWRALSDSNMGVAGDLDRVMLDLLATRRQIARNADEPDFRAYQWKALDRVDYTPADCRAFHDAVRDEVVPALTALVQDAARRLGLDSVRPWDYNRSTLPDPEGRPPLTPFSGGAELEALAADVFGALDADLAGRFAFMRGHGLLDLESRPGKMTHAYCQYFPVHNEPFVLMNVVGSADDVRVLFHEVGHAFHGFYSGESQRLLWNRWSPTEFVEIPSMAMEFLTLDHLGRVFTPEDLARYRASQLQGVVAFLPWAAQMDAFQHWLYHDAPQDVGIAELDARWLELDRTFHGFVNWDGLDEGIRAKGWQYYHIFQVPFYYIEYAMCYLAAVGVWRAAQADPARAMEDYKASLRLGSASSVPELYRAAGVEFRFDRDYIRGLTAFLTTQLRRDAAD